MYEDAVARFSEGGLRVMRAVRFAAALEFELDPDRARHRPGAALAREGEPRARLRGLRKILGSRAPRAPSRPPSAPASLPLDPARALRRHLDTWAPRRGWRAAAVAHWLARVDAVPPEARLGALLCRKLAARRRGAPRRLDRAAVKQAQDVLRRLKFSNEELAAAAIVWRRRRLLRPRLDRRRRPSPPSPT